MQAEKNILLVDAGNVFGYPGVQSRLKSETAVEAMAHIAYHAFNLSNLEFSFGLDFLLNTTEQFQVPTLSANIVYEDTGDPVTEPSRIISFDNFKVGITGVVGKKYEKTILESNTDNARPVAVLEEMTALQQQVNAVRDDVDILIVLANTGLDRAKEIAQNIIGINVIVCGHGANEIPSHYFFNGVYIVKAGYNGVDVGKLVLSLDARNNIIDAQGTVIALDKTIEEDLEILAILDNYHKRLKEYADELFDFVPKQPSSGGFYVGSTICSGCHASQSQKWNTTDHAEAFNSLIAKYQDYNPECVPCHVNGFGYIGGFKRPDYTPEMADVQCEMCHGAGGEHAASPQPGYGQISPLACIYCHTIDKSPNFDYATYYPRVAH
jgi:2',3'-cyclic-nucleotide 2'-phosphodiesterase (5'-nucleotidase family)